MHANVQVEYDKILSPTTKYKLGFPIISRPIHRETQTAERSQHWLGNHLIVFYQQQLHSLPGFETLSEAIFRALP
ncbi:hypothetical protein AWB78_07852 [Caballeronia calidae]|uniref:Uncharacterized protein n=1 Tax=Caballeronia calidae TaxID=1777139 RepID=A0A158EI26_9BURK|nr:hypothetical protein AWB78_07852 [Caballeronia calidae]